MLPARVLFRTAKEVALHTPATPGLLLQIISRPNVYNHADGSVEQTTENIALVVDETTGILLKLPVDTAEYEIMFPGVKIPTSGPRFV